MYVKVELRGRTSHAHILISFLRHWIPLVFVGEMELSLLRVAPQLSVKEGRKVHHLSRYISGPGFSS